MAIMILIVPFCFFAFWLFMETFHPRSDWRKNFLLSFVFINFFLVVLTEILSALHVLTAWGIFFGWLILLIGLILIWLIPGKQRKIKFPEIPLKSLNLGELTLVILMLVILVTVGAVALLSRPSVYDVLNYHMPRVAHWIQNHSVMHYPSGIEYQNRYPTFAEFQALQVFALTGSDLLVKFPAWTMLLVSMISGSLFAKELGINRSGQLFTSLFIATLPVALTQASSVKNDIHVAVWTLLLATFMLLFIKGKGSLTLLAAIGVTFGLGYLTKSTTMLFMLPLIVWFAFRCIKQYPFGKILLWLLIVLLIFLLINGGFFWRNVKTYGVLQDVGPSSRLLNDKISIAGTFSNLIRNAAFHLQYPWDNVRDWVELFILKVHVKLGLDLNDSRYTSDGHFDIKPPNTDTSFTGNTLHAHLLVITFIIASILLFKKKLPPMIWLPILISLSGYLLFSAVIKWQLFGGRYSLSLFFLAAPVFGLMVSKIPWTGVKLACAAALLILTIPWLISINDRPLLALSNYSSESNIIKYSRFNTIPRNATLRELPNLIDSYGCDQIGLYGTGRAKEYEIWSALSAPRDDLRIEWLVAGTSSAQYNDENFKPCLIVCVECSEDVTEIRGLVPIFNGPPYTIYGPAQ